MIKKISFLLAILVILQSCSVYHSPTSLAEAVAADKKVKITTADGQKYRLKRLSKEDERLIGLIKPGSPTANKLAHLPAERVDGFLKTDLSALDIEEVKLRNTAASTMGNILIPIAAFAAVLVAMDPAFFLPWVSSD